MEVKKTNKSKAVGNTFERSIAKQLSEWIYSDQHVLKREPTSGATKDNYVGDVYPAKQLTPNQPEWLYLVECKYGYTQNTPTLLNYKIVESWYLKSLQETKQSEKQKIILLIANFKGKRGVLLCTNKFLNCIHCNCVLCIRNNGDVEYVYCYDYGEMLKYKFTDVFCD